MPALLFLDSRARSGGLAALLAAAALLWPALPAGAQTGSPLVPPRKVVTTTIPMPAEPNHQRWARDVAPAAPATLDQLRSRRSGADGLDLNAYAAIPPQPAAGAQSPEQPARRTRMAASASLRAGPGAASELLATVTAGSEVGLWGCRGGWCEVTAGERRGYVASRFVQGQRAAASPKAGKSRRAAKAALPRADRVGQESTGLPGVFGWSTGLQRSNR